MPIKRGFYHEDPSLGYLLDSGKPILLSALKLMANKVALELVEHCSQPLGARDSDGNSLLMMALTEGRLFADDDVFLKLVALSSPLELLHRNNAGKTAKDLAKQYLRSSVETAIKAKLASNPPPSKVHISFDNKYASATELNGVMTFTIKAPITQPVFIKNYQAVIDNLEVNAIPYNDFHDVAMFCFPKAIGSRVCF